MFEHPPAFTHAIANLTAWFDWDALSAIGTVGAFWFLALEQTRASRADRLRRLGTLAALNGLLGPVVEDVPLFEGENGDPVSPADRGEIRKAIDLVEHASHQLSLFALPDLAAIGFVEFNTDLVVSLPAIAKKMHQCFASGKYSDYSREMDFVIAAHGFIARQHSRMERLFNRIWNYFDVRFLLLKGGHARPARRRL